MYMRWWEVRGLLSLRHQCSKDICTDCGAEHLRRKCFLSWFLEGLIWQLKVNPSFWFSFKKLDEKTDVAFKLGQVYCVSCESTLTPPSCSIHKPWPGIFWKVWVQELWLSMMILILRELVTISLLCLDSWSHAVSFSVLPSLCLCFT